MRENHSSGGSSLLRFISNADIRQSIHAETTKIESYNDFLDWVSFGGPVIKSGDPVEQDKQLKYASLVANTSYEGKWVTGGSGGVL